MDLQTLEEQCKKVQCPRFDDRKHRLQTLEWIRTRKWPKALKLPDFDDRVDATKKWRPFAKRRPGARYDIHAIVTRDVVAMLAGDGRFPIVTFENEDATNSFAEVVRTVGLPAVMNQAATLASIGSVVIVPEVIEPAGDGNPWLSWAFWRAFEVDPIFRRDRPNVLESVTRTWSVTRAQLAADGYNLTELDAKASVILGSATGKRRGKNDGAPAKYTSWYRRVKLDEAKNTAYEPVPKEVYHQPDWDAWTEDIERSTAHDLDFCPALWYTTWDDQDQRPDGGCIFEAAVDNAILIDRVLSVAANAVVAAGTPQLAIARKSPGPGLSEVEGESALNPAGREIDPDSILEVDEKGGAWLVQLEGGLTPLDVVLSRLRTITLENVGGSRMSEETAAGAKSGYAMELLNQALTYVAGLMRPGHERTALGLVRMLAKMVESFGDIDCEGGTLVKSSVVQLVEAIVKAISYGPNYELSGQDKAQEVTAVVQAVAANLISIETAIAQIAQLFDVTDIEGERNRVKSEATTKQDAESAAAEVEHKRQLELKTAAPPKPEGVAA